MELIFKLKLKIIAVYLGIVLSLALNAQSVGIGTLIADSSAALEVKSTSKGFLLPRMSFVQRNAIANPAAGLIIWCIDCDEMQIYDGIKWKNMSGTAAAGVTTPNVNICYDTWMIKNLNVTKYKNGDAIPIVSDPTAWKNLTTGAMCWLNNESDNDSTYGVLYNWYAVNDPRGLAPEGWHVASLDEWETMEHCLGNERTAGGKLKLNNTTLWPVINTGATNRSGFTAIPSAFRDGNTGLYYNTSNIFLGAWWTSTTYGSNQASVKYLINNGSMVLSPTANKSYGLSVRCIKD